eukprot:CAMPEP_0201668420 /NCGR_PEP_ID=MMETSP0494-20130426/19377_1 /ASSEMBLY_ACC=CAM_ASM_000839 /TAXON_ID=420259 /ORGANISM="Thalassiosira gravida, Strain GMp14c1" /LENGTH=64 /DNA_ID=CAMNT_0048148787 /DNA_START=38 /DNA_END=229 /DNA_ORIENTATION=-
MANVGQLVSLFVMVGSLAYPSYWPRYTSSIFTSSMAFSTLTFSSRIFSPAPSPSSLLGHSMHSK